MVINKNKMKYDRKLHYITIVLLMVIFLLFFLNRDFISSSDMDEHYKFALKLHLLFDVGIDRFREEVQYAHIISYPAWHLFFLLIYYIVDKVGQLFRYNADGENLAIVSQAIENTILVLTSYEIVVLCYEKYYRLKKTIAIILGVVITFVGPIYLPLISRKYYLGQFTANPWHNPTIFMARPIAIFCFFLYCYLYNQRTEGITKKKENSMFISFSVGLLVSAFCKPSFYQALLPALFVFCIIDMLVTKFKYIEFSIKTAIAVLPVCVLAIVQYLTSFGDGYNTIKFAPFEVWNIFSENKIGALLISMAFPIIVFVECKGKIFSFPDGLLGGLLFLSSVGKFVYFSF